MCLVLALACSKNLSVSHPSHWPQLKCFTKLLLTAIAVQSRALEASLSWRLDHLFPGTLKLFLKIQVDKWEFIFNVGVKSASFFSSARKRSAYLSCFFLSLVPAVNVPWTRIFINTEIQPLCSHWQYLCTESTLLPSRYFESYQFHGKKKACFSYCHL